VEPLRRFEQLEVWQRAHAWVIAIYRMTRSFPDDERFGITSQLRRAASSVPLNIVEGFHRSGIRDKLKYYNTAYASLQEARYALILSHDLGYADTAGLQDEAENVARLLHGLIASTRRRLDEPD
jgi:four helix bundle protein